ncbi:MAG TPA: hypothetical protein VGR49_06920 [Actinomycetota bacterium]|jgi:hypothetical protein|nr:hypothetical protein [Actinomycetota bacterium]
MKGLLLPAAALGPAAAGLVWAVLSSWRWPRRVAGAFVALAAHVAAWAVFWLAYRGEPQAWRSLEGSLLGATVLVATELAVALAALRAEGLGRRAALGAVPALGVSATAVAFASFSTSLVVQALFLPAVTIAAALGGLSGAGRRDVTGVLGLAVADVACLAGFAVWVSRVGSVIVLPTGSLEVGGALVLAGAAVKAGAVPGLGTWRLAASAGPGAPVATALRGQGIALAVLAGVVVSGDEGSLIVAALAAGAALVGGVAAAASARSGSLLAGVAGAAACVPFLSLGLGGAVGVRAFLLSFPPFLLASGALFAAGWQGAETPSDRQWQGERREGMARGLRRWIGVPAALAAVVSLAALPGGGGHPGTALAVDLAGVRAQTDVLYLGVAVALLLGLGMAAVAAAPVVAGARPSLPAGIAAFLTGAALAYMGSQPVRLGIGWWLRIERALEVPGLLPSAGAPGFPAARGIDLALALGPAAGAALLIALLGRGVRPGPAEVVPVRLARPARALVPALGPGAGEAPGAEAASPETESRTAAPEGEVAEPSGWKTAAGEVPRRVGALARAVGRRTSITGRDAVRWAQPLRARAHRMALGLAIAALLEAGAVALSVFLVMEGVRLGFL